MLVVCTAFTFSSCSVRSAFLGHESSILSKESMENGPATVTAFIHVVALHHELGWQLRLIAQVSILKLHSCLDWLNKAHRVAWAAFSLISQWSSEIIAANIPKIIMVRYLIVWNVIWRLVRLHPVLCSLHGLFELFSFLAENTFSGQLVLSEVSKLMFRFCQCFVICSFIFIELSLVLSYLFLLFFTLFIQSLWQSLSLHSVIQAVDNVLFKLLLCGAMSSLVERVRLLEEAWIGLPRVNILIIIDFLNFLVR